MVEGGLVFPQIKGTFPVTLPQTPDFASLWLFSTAQVLSTRVWHSKLLVSMVQTGCSQSRYFTKCLWHFASFYIIGWCCYCGFTLYIVHKLTSVLYRVSCNICVSHVNMCLEVDSFCILLHNVSTCVSVSISGEAVHSISAVSKMSRSWTRTRRVSRCVSHISCLCVFHRVAVYLLFHRVAVYLLS